MPVFPYQVGQLLFDGVVNGQKIYSQPGGIGTPVVPQPPQVNPPPNWKNSAYPPYPYCYVGLLNFICGHWANTCEVYTVNDPTTNQRAALCCCPVCSIIQLIVEPAAIGGWSFTHYFQSACGKTLLRMSRRDRCK